MATVTTFQQLKSYWWNGSKKGTVKVALRDLRPRNSPSENSSILGHLKHMRESAFFEQRFGAEKTLEPTQGFKAGYG
jgi:hypothetical protein